MKCAGSCIPEWNSGVGESARQAQANHLVVRVSGDISPDDWDYAMTYIECDSKSERRLTSLKVMCRIATKMESPLPDGEPS